MNLGLKNRVAMIAAASKGIGKACALALAAEGCKVSICARNLLELDIASDEIGMHGDVLVVPADVSNPADLAHWHIRTLERFGHVDILVTNTGGPPVSRFMDLTDEQWHAGVEVYADECRAPVAPRHSWHAGARALDSPHQWWPNSR
ncbi:MAG: SDR family NAD(P)-dependent oxidoreductase [Blastocatellia bacterium]